MLFYQEVDEFIIYYDKFILLFSVSFKFWLFRVISIKSNAHYYIYIKPKLHIDLANFFLLTYHEYIVHSRLNLVLFRNMAQFLFLQTSITKIQLLLVINLIEYLFLFYF